MNQKRILYFLAAVLALSYISFLLAELFWVFDLFSHFLFQYVIGGVVVGFLLIFCKSYKLAGLMFVLSVASFVQSRTSLDDPLSFFKPDVVKDLTKKSIKIVQFNHYYGKSDLTKVEHWLKSEAENFDIVVLQEASEHTENLAVSLRDLYPHQVIRLHMRTAGVVIISRLDIIEEKVKILNGPIFENIVVRLAFKFKENEEPLIMYALHALPPVTPKYFAQRNFEIIEVAKLVAEEKFDPVVMVGDWNITPYSPYFKKILKVSKLKYQAKGFLLSPSWPYFAGLSFLKIPIDHLLFSESFSFVNKKVLSSFGSDHHAVLTELSFK